MTPIDLIFKKKEIEGIFISVYGKINNEVKADRLSRYFSPNIVSELSKESDSDKILGGKNHEKMLEIVFQNQGTIDKFIGDGILITFGTPIPDNSDTESAIKTAVQMQKT